MKNLIMFITMLFLFAVQAVAAQQHKTEVWPPGNDYQIFITSETTSDSKAEIIKTSAGGLAKQKSASIVVDNYKSRVIETKTGLKPIDSYFRLCS